MNLRSTYQVNEIFQSIQGEGVLTGIWSTFIRLQGCTVGCEWCDSGPLADLPEKSFLDNAMADAIMARDEATRIELQREMDRLRYRQSNGMTKNTWTAGGHRMQVEEILAQVDTHHVIITGGEPTMYDLDGLMVPLHRDGRFVQLETSGQNDIKGTILPDWITWSPKSKLSWDAPYRIRAECMEVKWVIEPVLTWETMVTVWDEMIRIRPNGLPHFVLMPEGSPPKQRNIERAIETLKMVPFEFQPYWRYAGRIQYDLNLR